MNKILLVLILFLLQGKSLYSQDEMFKALFIYNFTKEVEWPESTKSGDFKIVVVGSSAIVGELEKLAGIKKVGNQSIQVIKVNNADEVPECHLLYITPGKSALLGNIASNITNKPILIITDKPGLANQGACINFIKVDGKQKFEINTGKITERGLKSNSYLTSLGILVN